MGDDLVLYSARDSLWLQKHPALGFDVMQHVYNRLDAKYPGIWGQSFPSAEAIAEWKATWAEAFDEAKLTPADVVAGLKCVSTLYPDYPPKEGQFVKCCRYIDPFEAYNEALVQLRRRDESGQDVWSRSVIYWAAIRFGTGELRHSSWAKVEARWTRLLNDVMTHGPFDPVPPKRVALPAPSPKPAMVGEDARRHLAEMRAKLGRPARPAVPQADVSFASEEEIAAELALVKQRMAEAKK